MVDIKNSFSDFLIDELGDHLSKPGVKHAKNLLSRKVTAKVDLDELKKNLESLKPELPVDLYDYLCEEIDQIENDLDWKTSETGKSILQIYAWRDEFLSDFRNSSEFDEVHIGGHTEKDAVVIIGEVNSEETLQRLKKYIISKQPPFEVIFEIEVNA